MANRARTMVLQPHDTLQSVGSPPDGTIRLIIYAVSGDAAVGFTGASTVGASEITSDADFYVLKQGQTLELDYRPSIDVPVRVGSANPSGGSASIVSILTLNA